MNFEKVYVNDFDGNILNTPTCIYIDVKQANGGRKTIKIPGHEFDKEKAHYEKIGFRRTQDNTELTFRDFQDFSHTPNHRGTDGLINDIKHAIDNGDFAASFETFKHKALIEGQLFGILTARPNIADNLKRGTMLINEQTLNKEEKEEQIENIRKRFGFTGTDKQILQQYFDANCFMPVGNYEWMKAIGHTLNYNSSSINKTLAMDRYFSYLERFLRSKGIKSSKENQVSLGFSNDTLSNIVTMNNRFADYKEFSSANNHNSIYFNPRSYYTGPKDSHNSVKNHLIDYMIKNPTTSIEVNFEEKQRGGHTVLKTSFDFNISA